MKAIKRLVALLVASAMLVVPVMASDVAWNNTSDPIDWYYGDGASDVTVGAVESPAEAPVLVEFTIEGTGKSYKVYEDGKVKLTGIKPTSKKLTMSTKVTKDGVEYKLRAIAKGTLDNAENLKKINFRSKAKIALGKNLFKNLDTSKMTANFNKKMTDERFEAMKAKLEALGFEGKILHTLEV